MLVISALRVIFVVARFRWNTRIVEMDDGGGGGADAWALLRFQAWKLQKTLPNVNFIWCAALFYIVGSCHKAQITAV